MVQRRRHHLEKIRTCDPCLYLFSFSSVAQHLVIFIFLFVSCCWPGSMVWTSCTSLALQLSFCHCATVALTVVCELGYFGIVLSGGDTTFDIVFFFFKLDNVSEHPS